MFRYEHVYSRVQFSQLSEANTRRGDDLVRVYQPISFAPISNPTSLFGFQNSTALLLNINDDQIPYSHNQRDVISARFRASQFSLYFISLQSNAVTLRRCILFTIGFPKKDDRCHFHNFERAHAAPSTIKLKDPRTVFTWLNKITK